MKESSTVVGTTKNDTNHLRRLVKASNKLREREKKKNKNRNSRNPTVPSTVVNLDNNGVPTDLLGGGEHFRECPPRQLESMNTTYPMDVMMNVIETKGLKRPIVS